MEDKGCNDEKETRKDDSLDDADVLGWMSAVLLILTFVLSMYL